MKITTENIRRYGDCLYGFDILLMKKAIRIDFAIPYRLMSLIIEI